MIGSKIPRYRILISALGVAMAIIILATLYGQYRWFSNEILITNVAEHSALLEARFELTAGAQLRQLAERLSMGNDTLSEVVLRNALRRALAENDALSGSHFYSPGLGQIVVGEVPDAYTGETVAWLPDRLVMSYPVARGNDQLGIVTGAFRLDTIREESANFANQLRDLELSRRWVSYLWMGAATLMALFAFALAVWLVVRRQTTVIDEFREKVEILNLADFVERLPETHKGGLGELAAVFNTMRDQLQATTTSHNYIDNILAGMNEAIIVTTNEGTIKRINRATTILLGYTEDELIGHSIDTVVNKEKDHSLLGDGDVEVPKEAFLDSKIGEMIPVSYTCSIIDNHDGSEKYRVYAAQNISERRRAEQRIRYLARIDALTKIPNRMQFQHLLQRSIARSRRAGKPLCLFYIDIDHFKEINDTFGHLAGDTTLETVAERLSAALPDGSIIGRLAGDEFAVIVSNIATDSAGEAKTDKLARSLLDRLADPFFVQGHEVFMTASMGIAHYPKDAPNVIDLIRNADAALYSAKKSGGNVFSYYKPQMNEAAVERLMTKSRLKRAFERDELLVHYQPKYNLITGDIIGAEALVRWELPDRGLILPADFIPIAEDSNLIVELGEWVLDKVCEDFRFWLRSVSFTGRISVNLSLKQLRQANFINRISAIMRGHEISPTSLELEITETTLMENPKRTIKLLDQLYGLGLHLAIDDFGTGYSSLSALQQFPISTLKIDQSFVRHVATNPDDATIVGTIIQMGRNLNMDVVAEGVETEEQLYFLQQLDCTYVQGLLFGDPMSSENFLELLNAQVEGTKEHRALFA